MDTDALPEIADRYGMELIGPVPEGYVWTDEALCRPPPIGPDGQGATNGSLMATDLNAGTRFLLGAPWDCSASQGARLIPRA